MAIFEYTTLIPFAEVLNHVNSEDQAWGLVCIKRHYLRAMTDQAFMLAVRPTLNGVTEAHVALIGQQHIYIAWSGKQRLIYKLLRNLASTSLMRPGLTVDANVLVTYLDPLQHKEEIKQMLAAETADTSLLASDTALDNFDDDLEMTVTDALDASKVSAEQMEIFHEACANKHYRRQLHILVVEDVIFSQKLLCEILRSVRVRNNNDSPLIDAVQSLRAAWKIFLKRAPDIVFVDLNLIDGSGHTLARAIKEVDPQTNVIIVTANSSEEELSVARQNNVDGFITKPYNTRQILDGIGRYIGTNRTQKGGVFSGGTSQF
jgi:two-component system chemotaxis response regulator CheY